MNLETITNSVVDFVRANHEFAPIVLALLTFGESLAFVSLVVPAATILIGVGFVVAAAEIPFWQAWLGAVCGGVLGGAISFAIGRRYKAAAYAVWPLSRNARLIERGERFFQRFGPWAVFFGRFFGPTRAVLPLIAGIFLMPAVLFQSANMASAFVWAFIVLAPGAGLAKFLF
ncbi:MAG: DedA family protein [Microvirga sp.]|jgi:membrane protein DedA with SNARE-associated domain|uniref:DedA family protein n=1 Tax=Microvirga brassicacearum TaxID=2580413 RepID=A0A5N3PB42_9HYPH|nr:DedA family protein [Microvirga brassicacearum]KAB0266982.1 DedA family protein [Microvirga brassicacearum]MDF2812174.1 DedA family protein [Microvirga sp.]